jgi:nucleotide-binding universal stress UspA family protein
MADIKRILVPTDFSAPADAALTYAIDLASKLGASISLVHVFDDPSGIHTGEYVPMPSEMRGEIVADLRRRLAELVAKRGHSELNPQLLVGPTARTIVETARDSGADLIVIGTHGRHGMSRLLIGSVAERVVRTATCPVLTVRSAATAADGA